MPQSNKKIKVITKILEEPPLLSDYARFSNYLPNCKIMNFLMKYYPNYFKNPYTQDPHQFLFFEIAPCFNTFYKELNMPVRKPAKDYVFRFIEYEKKKKKRKKKKNCFHFRLSLRKYINKFYKTITNFTMNALFSYNNFISPKKNKIILPRISYNFFVKSSAFPVADKYFFYNNKRIDKNNKNV